MISICVYIYVGLLLVLSAVASVLGVLICCLYFFGD